MRALPNGDAPKMSTTERGNHLATSAMFSHPHHLDRWRSVYERSGNSGTEVCLHSLEHWE